MTHRSNNSGFTRRRFLGAGLAVSAGFAVSGLPGVASADSNVVTIYAADGLRNGQPNWFDTVFDAFTKQTGIQVQ